MTPHPDPYATEAETDALLAADTRTPAERRLAACWNACDGVPVEVLEAQQSGGLPWSVADQIEERVQRDELLAALQMWLDIHENPAGFAGKYGKALDHAIAAQQLKVDAAAAAARAAIANVTPNPT